ncbi:MAG: formimidoylglutamate deiminase [Alphaproteobacteria bacterium]
MYTFLMAKAAQKYHFKKILLTRGWAENVSLEVGGDGLISAIEADQKPSGEKVSGIAIPAICNAHSHAFQRAFVGLTEESGGEGDDFWSWRKVMYGALTKIGPKELEAIAAWLYVEMLKSGYAGVGEFHYLHHQASGAAYDNPAEMSEALIRAANSSGIDFTLLSVLYQRADFGTSDINEGQRPFFFELDDYAALLGHLSKKCRTGVALHSLRAVPEDVISKAAALSSGPVHIHIAEQVMEVERCLEVHGKRPVEWLLDNVEVDENWNLVHATHLTPEEITGIAKSGATVVLCPTTEANLGDGLFPLEEFIAAGGKYSIGSDSHVSIDPREELRLLEYGQRLTSRKRGIAGKHPGAALWGSAVKGGANAMGHEKSSIQVGVPAHIAVLDENAPSLAGRDGDAILDSLVFAGQPNPIRDVMVSGQWQVKDFRHKNEDALRARFVSVMKAL